MNHPARVLKSLGRRAHRGLGQNFLAEPGVARSIVRYADLGAGSRVLEVGTGLGALTGPLVQSGARVVGVEQDRELAAWMQRQHPEDPEAKAALRRLYYTAEKWNALLEILKEEGDTKYRNYIQMLNSLKYEFVHLDEKTWRENLYWSWLSCLRSLVETRPFTYPPSPFMGTKAWTLKELNTALGSWAELRHDTILYAKQSYTLMATAIPPSPKFTKGYVEPYPHLYSQIRDLVTQLREGLSSQGLLLDEPRGKLLEFEELLNSLTAISRKELQGKTLSDEEYRLIWDIGSKLEGIIRFSPELMKKITSGTDRKMAVVADVHTDVNTQQVLEEGVGNPSIIYLIAQVEGKPTLTKGGAFSYYEFKQPMQDRLTDEGWQELLAKRQGPNPPKWANGLYPR